MSKRKEGCFREGTLSENRFATYLENRGIDYETVVGTTADTKGKVDFIVKGKTVNVKAPTMSGPRGLCTEWRAVDGSVGWIHKVDYIVKFIDDKTFAKIPVSKLKAHVLTTRGTPPDRCPQTGASRSRGGWYARADWDGKIRSGEACIMIPSSEILPFSVIATIS